MKISNSTIADNVNFEIYKIDMSRLYMLFDLLNDKWALSLVYELDVVDNK